MNKTEVENLVALSLLSNVRIWILILDIGIIDPAQRYIAPYNNSLLARIHTNKTKIKSTSTQKHLFPVDTTIAGTGMPD